MAFNLMSLLQSATGLEPEVEDVTVTGNRRPSATTEESPAPIPLGNRSFLEEAAEARSGSPQRSGKFGVKGTFRDILGLLGDAFLVQSGNKSVYDVRRQEEDMADAMSGFSQNPMAAAERLAAMPGGAEMAQKLYDDQQTNALRQAQIQSLGDTRRSQIAERDYKKTQDFGNYAARVMAKADTPEKQAAALRLLTKRAAATGIDLEEFGIMEGMSPEDRAAFASGDMTVNQQEQLPRRDRQLDISDRNATTAERNAQSNRIRANRPPAGRAAPQPTNAAMAAPLLRRLESGQTLSPAQSEILERLGYSKDRGRGRGRRTGAGASAATRTPSEGDRRRNNRTNQVQTFRNGQWQ